MNKFFELNQILDNEIKFCEKFNELLSKKRDLIVHSKAMDLKEHDEKIFNAQKKLAELKLERSIILKKIGSQKTLSDLISTLQDNTIARELEFKRQKMQKLIQQITITNNVTNSLIEHSLKMIDGSIEAIAKASRASQTKDDYYNQRGVKHQQELQTLSAIIREA